MRRKTVRSRKLSGGERTNSREEADNKALDGGLQLHAQCGYSDFSKKPCV